MTKIPGSTEDLYSVTKDPSSNETPFTLIYFLIDYSALTDNLYVVLDPAPYNKVCERCITEPEFNNGGVIVDPAANCCKLLAFMVFDNIESPQSEIEAPAPAT